MNIWTDILFALSLCADCFAVSLCSGITMKNVRMKQTLVVSLCFAVIQAGLLLVGCVFGCILAGLFEKLARVVGFLLLLYVGGSMLVEGIRGEGESLNLGGLKNIILGGIATSIDALAAGISISAIAGAGISVNDFIGPVLAVFFCTFLSVSLGIAGGKFFGMKAGRWAEIAGGIVLLIIGIVILI